uniref:PA domain-containing protein n=2 Tax=Ciona intestinalis TaxID=7719 RepID=F6SPQ8_CIOIN
MYKLSILNMLKYCVWAVVIFVFLQAGESSVEARRRKRKGADVSGPPSRRHRKHNKLNRNNHHALDSSLTSTKTDDTHTKTIIDQYIKSRRRGSRKQSKSYTVKKWTEANVTVGTKVDELSLSNLEQSLGKFGHHSRRENIVGRVIHITDPGLENSHHGCGHTMSNRHMIPNNETWVALIKRGYCYFFNKIKLGERYNASAVVIYDDKPGKIEIMNTIGTNVVSLMISHEAGIKFAKLADSGLNVYMNITVG